MGHFVTGEVALNDGNYEVALREYRAAVENDPTSPLLRLRLATLLVRTGALAAALEHCQAVVDLQPDSIEARLLLAGILSALNRQDDAAAQYARVIESRARQPGSVPLPGRALRQARPHGRRRRDARQLIALNPQSVLGFYYLGRVNAAANRYDKAEYYYREALKRSPHSELILMDLATLFELQKQYARAIELYKQVLAANPNSALVRKRLGGLYIGQKKLDEALLQFHALEQIETDPEETRIKIALIYFEKGEYDRAATELNLVLAAEPDNDRVRYYVGAVYTETKEYTKAAELFEKIKPDSEYYVDARIQMAAMYQRQGKLDAALREVEHAIKVKGRQPELLSYLGVPAP